MPYLTTRKNLKLQLSPGLVVSYDIQPGNGVGLFWDTTHLPDQQGGMTLPYVGRQCRTVCCSLKTVDCSTRGLAAVKCEDYVLTMMMMATMTSVLHGAAVDAVLKTLLADIVVAKMTTDNDRLCRGPYL